MTPRACPAIIPVTAPLTTARKCCCRACEQHAPHSTVLARTDLGEMRASLLAPIKGTRRFNLNPPPGGRESLWGTQAITRKQPLLERQLPHGELRDSFFENVGGGSDPERTILCPPEATFRCRPHKGFVLLPGASVKPLQGLGVLTSVVVTLLSGIYTVEGPSDC